MTGLRQRQHERRRKGDAAGGALPFGSRRWGTGLQPVFFTGCKPVPHRAVTLLEVTLALGLLVLLSSTTFWFYQNTLERRTEAIGESQKLQLVRILLEQMSRELRYASSFTPGYGTGLSGGKGFITVLTPRLPRKLLSEERSLRDGEIPGEFDLMEIKYYIARHDEIEDEDGFLLALGLVRKETRTLNEGRNRSAADDEDEGGGMIELDFDEKEFDELVDEEIGELTTVKEELYAPEIKYLRFHYFDGARWWPDWQLEGANSLPQIVRITVGFEPHPPPDDEFAEEEEDLFLEDPQEQDPLPPGEYTTFVRILQSDIFFGSRITRTAQDIAEKAMEEAEGF